MEEKRIAAETEQKRLDTDLQVKRVDEIGIRTEGDGGEKIRKGSRGPTGTEENGDGDGDEEVRIDRGKGWDV